MVSSQSSVEGLNFVFYNNDVFSSNSGIQFELQNNSSLNIALGQGFLPQCPIHETSFGGMSQKFAVRSYDGVLGNYYYHSGIDCDIRGTGPQPIYAPVSGMLLPDPIGGWGNCNNVNLSLIV